MTEFTEDRVFDRHPRRRGAVLIVGAGAVGGLLAVELAPAGISPLVLVDHDQLQVENLIRHPLGADAVGKPKASSLAARIHADRPFCKTKGIDKDFLLLPEAEQRRLVRNADLVVAATDNFECQRQVNRVCFEMEKQAVFPAVWVDPRLRDAEVGEVLWVVPGRHTPCYECAVAFREGSADAQAARGRRVDIQLLVNVTAQVVTDLLDLDDPRSRILDPERTCIYVHGFTPTSRGIRDSFPTHGLRNVNVHVPFPETPCPACGGHELRPAPLPPLRQPRPQPTLPPPDHSSAIAWGVIAVLLVVGLIVFGVYKASHHPTSSASSQAPVAQPSAAASSTPTTNEQPISSSGANGWSSGQQIDNNGLTAISCPSTGSCMSVDSSGYAYTYSGNSWSSGQQIDSSGSEITSISCPSTGFCGAISSGATAYIESEGSWSSSNLVGEDGGAANLTAISCPTAGYCVATGNYNVYVYTNGSWSTGDALQLQGNFTAISCPTTSYCVATDDDGNVYVYANGSWSNGQQIGSSNELIAISCPSTSFCGAITSGDSVYIDSDGSWSSSNLVGADGNSANLTAISCPSDGYCLATGNLDAYVYSGSTWATGTVVQQNNSLTSISCPTTSYCIATDDEGNVYSYAGR